LTFLLAALVSPQSNTSSGSNRSQMYGRRVHGRASRGRDPASPVRPGTRLNPSPGARSYIRGMRQPTGTMMAKAVGIGASAVQLIHRPSARAGPSGSYKAKFGVYAFRPERQAGRVPQSSRRISDNVLSLELTLLIVCVVEKRFANSLAEPCSGWTSTKCLFSLGFDPLLDLKRKNSAFAVELLAISLLTHCIARQNFRASRHGCLVGRGGSCPRRPYRAGETGDRATTTATTRALEHVQAFSIPGGIPKSREQCESSVPWGMEGDHGASLQPRLA
jgi:hypothetical protein